MFSQHLFEFGCTGISRSGTLCDGVAAIVYGADDTHIIIGNALFVGFTTTFIRFSGHYKIIIFGMVAFKADWDIGFIDYNVSLQFYFVVEQL